MIHINPGDLPKYLKAYREKYGNGPIDEKKLEQLIKEIKESKC